jgi:hypothetical protein
MSGLVVNFAAARRAIEQLGRVGDLDQRRHVVDAVVAENRAGRDGRAVAHSLQQLAMQQRGRPGGAA